MILTVDVGNTNITFGGYEKRELCFTARMATEHRYTADQYAAEILCILELYQFKMKDITDGIISCVVPECTYAIAGAIEKICGKKPLIIGPGLKSGLNIMIDNPAQLGADLVCAAVAAIQQYPLPCLVLDLGTATKISVLDQNGAYLGCTISPGVNISLHALSSGASQLPGLSLEAPRSVIGTNTVSSMLSGTVYGTAAMLDGLCDRIEAELKTPVKSLVATGGLCEDIVRHCRRKMEVSPHLIHDGLLLIYEKNRKDGKEYNE